MWIRNPPHHHNLMGLHKKDIQNLTTVKFGIPNRIKPRHINPLNLHGDRIHRHLYIMKHFNAFIPDGESKVCFSPKKILNIKEASDTDKS